MRPLFLKSSSVKMMTPFLMIGFVAAASYLLAEHSDTRLKSAYYWTRHDKHAVPPVKAPNPSLNADRVDALLRTVHDPEIDINIVDLGLISKVRASGGRVEMTLTLTTPSCPFSIQMLDSIKAALFTDPRINSVNLEISFDPPWTVDRVAPEIRARLFGQNTGHTILEKEGSR